MTIADFLSFVGIAVSVIVGFLITRFSSVRDTRTRVIKDYYIEQLKQIKRNVDGFYHRVPFGKMSARDIIAWYEHINLDIKSTEKGIRNSLDIQFDEYYNVLDKYYGEITGWEDYNNSFPATKYVPDNNSKIRLGQIKYENDGFLNDYIQHVNQANRFPIWIEQWRRIKQSQSFYKTHERKYPFFLAMRERIEKHIFESIFTISIICGIIWMFFAIKPEEKENLEKPLNEISQKQDSIYMSIKSFKEKYEPIKVNTKTFNKSAFFNADKVDSVHIKLYQGK